MGEELLADVTDGEECEQAEPLGARYPNALRSLQQGALWLYVSEVKPCFVLTHRPLARAELRPSSSVRSWVKTGNEGSPSHSHLFASNSLNWVNSFSSRHQQAFFTPSICKISSTIWTLATFCFDCLWLKFQLQTNLVSFSILPSFPPTFPGAFY